MTVEFRGQTFHTHQDIHDHVLAHGLAKSMPLALRRQLVENGIDPPRAEGTVGIGTPPHVGDGDPHLVGPDGQMIEVGGPRCAHCGRRVEPEQNLRQHAVAGFEHTDLRLLIRHCDECLDSDYCREDVSSPGSGHSQGSPAGFCEPFQGVTRVVSP